MLPIIRYNLGELFVPVLAWLDAVQVIQFLFASEPCGGC